MTNELIEAMARAHDREQAAQMGEPSPWGFDDLDPEWIDCRMVAMREAIAAAKAAGYRLVPGWVSVEERLPEDMRPVLALYRNESNLQRIVRAIYVQRMAWERCYDDGLDDYGDYDPETDQHYWPAGWYECAENAEHLYVMSEAVTQWMPMPPAPEPDHAENVLNLIRQTQGMNRDE